MSRGSRAASWGQRALQLLFALCLLGLLLLPAQRYGWMRELDPGLAGALPDDASGNRVIVVNLLLAGAVGAQLLAAWLAATARGRWLALALGVVALAVWALRFGGG